MFVNLIAHVSNCMSVGGTVKALVNVSINESAHVAFTVTVSDRVCVGVSLIAFVKVGVSWSVVSVSGLV